MGVCSVCLPSVQAVADGVSRGSRDGVDAGQGGVGGLVAKPSQWDQMARQVAAVTGPNPVS